jgi:lipopolysaccharide/colanic/teichoic acid biosynthesis glycosyltransferase
MDMLVKERTKKTVHRKKPSASRPPEGHLRLETKIQAPAYFRWKEIAERAAAVVLLLPGLPLIGLLVLLVRLHSRGPGILRQARLGKNARVFEMLKIRTMRHDAEAKTGAVWAKADDPRVTSLGRFLRRVHLDELPQLINVVKGEMALIGPRPERPEIAAVLADEIPGYADRLVVRPGVTGLAQINLPPDSTVDDVRRKLALDVEYVRQAGWWLDTRIFLSTSTRLLGLSGDKAMRLFGLRRSTIPIGNAHPAMPAGGNGNGSGPTTPVISKDAATLSDDLTDGNSGNGNGNGRKSGLSRSTPNPKFPCKPR